MTGKNKKMNFPVFKAIKISETQNENWNPKLIRIVLENNPIVLLKQLCKLMDEKMDYNEIPNEDDIKLIKQIEELIK